MNLYLQWLATSVGKWVTLGVIWAAIIAINIVILPSRHAIRVQVETMKIAPLSQVVRAPGTIEPLKSVVLKTEFEGPILSKHFKEGDAVRKGQLLLHLGRDKIRLDYESKSIGLENAKADVRRAEQEAKIQKALFKRGAVARASVDDANRAVTRASQDLRKAEEEFKQQSTRWNADKVYALFDGTILKDSAGDETSLAAGKEIATLADLSEYHVLVKVDELDIPNVRKGQRAIIRLQTAQQAPISAEVIGIGGQAEATMQMEVSVMLRVDPVPGLVLRPKQTAIAHIRTGEFGNVMSVPMTALASAGQDTQVWVVTGAGRLRLRKVVTGRSNPDRVEITQGLREGERVSIQSNPKWVNGMKVIASASRSMVSQLGKGSGLPPDMPPEIRERMEKFRAQGGGSSSEMPPEMLERFGKFRDQSGRPDSLSKRDE